MNSLGDVHWPVNSGNVVLFDRDRSIPDKQEPGNSIYWPAFFAHPLGRSSVHHGDPLPLYPDCIVMVTREYSVELAAEW